MSKSIQKRMWVMLEAELSALEALPELSNEDIARLDRLASILSKIEKLTPMDNSPAKKMSTSDLLVALKDK